VIKECLLLSLSLLTLGDVFQALDLHLLLLLLLFSTVSLVFFSIDLVHRWHAVQRFAMAGIFCNCSLSLWKKISLLEALPFNFLFLSDATPYSLLS